jgi:murein DD-endopeptidase MepM/ murein hydrolase activator NlpD
MSCGSGPERTKVVARHRSPQGRRAHLRLAPPTIASAGAGAGGAYRRLTNPQVGSSVPDWLPGRFVAAAVAGSVLAATGQMALAQVLPAALEGDNVLRLAVDDLLGSPAAAGTLDPAPRGVEQLPAVAPVVSEPQVVGAADLIKAVELDRIAVEQAARAAEEARVAELARAAEQEHITEERAAAESAIARGGGVQMMVGRITSGFGPRWDAQHKGLDIAAPIGTPIRVPLDGTVIDSGPASGFGLWVRVRHADGTITLYGHIDRTLVEVGQRVSAGEVIAEVGNRGQSTGPHLHFEVITASGNINPTPWLAERDIGVT